MALALYWVWLVPIFMSPDEFDHFDYALCLNERRGLLPADADAHISYGWRHPYTFHLIESTDALDMILHPGARVPLEYGSRECFDRINRTAPPRSACAVDHAPGMAKLYPFGFYGLLALWLEGVRWFVGDQPVGLFFGARCLSVALLGISLLLTYAILRELNVRRWSAVILTGCVGCFPMVTFVASYVQPDNLALTLVSACGYLALCLRRRPESVLLQALLGLMLGVLLVTKLHFYLCVFVCTAAMIGSRWLTSQPRWLSGLRCLALLTVPSAGLGFVHLWVTGKVRNYHLTPAPYAGFISHYLDGFTKALCDFFMGSTHQSFWGVFGWLNSPLVIGGPRLNRTVEFIVQAAAWILLGLTLLRLEQVGTRLVGLARRGRLRRCCQLAFGNVPVNSYFVFTVLMFALYVRTDNRFGAQGRNWLPFMMPIFWVAIAYSPRALKSLALRRALRFGVVSGLLFYATVGSAYAPGAIRNHYYCSQIPYERAAVRVPLGASGQNFSNPLNHPLQVDFGCPVDKIEMVEVLLSAAKQGHGGTVELCLCDGADNILRKSEIGSDEIRDKAWREFRFPALAGVRDRDLKLRLTYRPSCPSDRANISAWSDGSGKGFMARLVTSEPALASKYYRNKQIVGPYPPEPWVPVLLAGKPFDFSFTCKIENVHGVDVRLSTCGKKNLGTVAVELLKEDGTSLGISSLDAACLVDNSYRWFPMPARKGLKERKLRLRLVYEPPPGTAAAVVAWVDPTKPGTPACRLFGE
jgi:hypothetical protein